ncbi:MAG: TonB-dependent receptor [Pedobacter sp.]|nr:MAG: TonB-dependent receptor [Pedobacter sp.]
MRLIIILSVLFFFQASANSLAQKRITINEKNATFESVLNKISKQTKFDVIYNSNLIIKSKPISIKANNELLVDVLKRCVEGLNVDFIIESSTIVIKDKKPQGLSRPANKIGYKINGIVRDELDLPFIGVSVKVVGTSKVAITDANGKFSIEVEPTDQLEFIYIGYKTQTISVRNQVDLLVKMEPEAGSLNEVAIVGFGKQKKVSVVGALTTIKPEELRIPTSNLSNALAGKLAGVVAYQRSGEPGADGATFYIRGISTFSGATSPLIILDGVAVSSGDLNALAPEVIESFSILKDATATAIYGSRGANGVMIVTTKSGKDLDKPRINIRLENSISTPNFLPKFVDGPRYMELYNEAVIGRSTGDVPYSADKINGTRAGLDPYLYPNVDWYNKLFKSNSQNRSLNFNIMGGGKRVDYFMSGTFNNDNGILRNFDLNSFDNNINVKRYSFQNNLNANLTNTTKVALRLNTQLRDYRGPATPSDNIYGSSANSIFNNAIRANAVDFPAVFPRLDGSTSNRFGSRSGGTINGGYINPLAELAKGYSNGFQSTVIATIDGEQKLDHFVNGLSFKALGSFKNYSNTVTNRTRGVNIFEINAANPINPDQSYNLSQIGGVQSEVLATTNGSTGDRTIYFQTSLDYSRLFAEKHSVSGLLLYNQQEYNSNGPTSLITSLPRRSQGFAGRATYSYDNKYLAEFNFGYNGSENFAEGKRFGFFPSAALGYVLSNEKFFEPWSNTVNLLKFRGSWGLVGNDQIGSDRFVYLSDINLTGSTFRTGIDQNYEKSGPLYNRFQNNSITWEVAEKINIGMDLTLFNNLNIVVDVFKENRTNIFLTRKIIPDFLGTGTALTNGNPSNTGTTIYGNLGEVKNEGIDVSVDYFRQFSNDFSMSLKGTFTYAHNTVIANDDPIFLKYKNSSLVGHSINTSFGYYAQRLFIDQAEINNSPTQQIGGFVQAGDLKYRDITNDIDGLNLVNSDDRAYMGFPTVPEIVYGFGPSFKYKKLDFSFFFQGVARTSLMMSSFHPFGPTSSYNNVLSFIDEDHWSQSNPNIYAAYPRLSKLDNPNNTTASSYWLRSGAFLKLRNAEIGYRFKFARVYLSGLNLLTFSKFKLWDPEQGGGSGVNNYPTQRVYNIGLQMGF